MYFENLYGPTSKPKPTIKPQGKIFGDVFGKETKKITAITPKPVKKTTPITPTKPVSKPIKSKTLTESLFSTVQSIASTAKREAGLFKEGFKTVKPRLQQSAGIIASDYAKKSKLLSSAPDALPKVLRPLFKNPYDEIINKPLARKAEKEAPKLKETGKKGFEKAELERLAKFGKKEGTVGFLEDLIYSSSSTVSSVGIGVIAGVVTKNPALAVYLGMGDVFTQGASEVYRDADKYGIKDETQKEQLALVGGVGYAFLSKFGLDRLINKSPAASILKRTFIQNLYRMTVSAGTQAGIEGANEGAEQLLANALAKTYDENRLLWSGIPESVIGGAIMGSATDVALGTSFTVLGASANKVDEALRTQPENRSEEQKKIVSMLLEKQMTPDEAMAMVIDKKLQKTEEGREIVKAVAVAKKENKNVIVRSSEDGQSISIDVVSPQEASNPVSSKAVMQTKESKMYKMDEIVSIKEEKESSMIEADKRIDEALAGKRDARKPIEVMQLQSGKYLVVDGNATYQALSKKGYTEIPAVLTDTSKLQDAKIPDDAVINAAKEYYKADAQRKDYGKTFASIANELGLNKINKETGGPAASVKSIVGILEKRHVRGAKKGSINNKPVNDILRDTIIIKKSSDVGDIISRLREKGYKGLDGEGRIDGLKNRYTDTAPGYKDANYQFIAPDGQVVELQMMQQNMYEAKEMYGHYIYDLYEKVANLPDVTPEQKALIDILKQKADRVYRNAYALDNPTSLEKSGSLANANSDSSVSVSTGKSLFTESDINSSKDILYTLRQASSISLRSVTENFDKKLGDLLANISGTPFTYSISQNENKSQQTDSAASKVESSTSKDVANQSFYDTKAVADWQLTRKEYADKASKRVSGQSVGKTKKLAELFHTDVIRKALTEGKPVPENVLKDYPREKYPTLNALIKSNVAQESISDAPITKNYDQSGKLIVENKRKKVLTGNEVKAIREVIEAKLSQLTTTASNAEQYRKGVKNIYDDILERSQGDKVVLSALRTELNKEMFGIAGASGNYREAYATLKTIQKNEPEIGEIIDIFEEYIIKLDDILTSTPDPEYQRPASIPRKTTQKQQGNVSANEPVGQGKVKKSTAYKKIAEARIAEQDRLSVTYNQVKQDDDFENAVNFVEKNPEAAIRVSLGLENAPAGIRYTSIAITTAEKAFYEDNIDLWNHIEAASSLRATRSGQEIVAYRGRFTNDSPHTYMKELLSRRLFKLGGNVSDAVNQSLAKMGNVKEKAFAKIDKEVSRLQQKIKKDREKIGLAQDFIDKLRC